MKLEVIAKENDFFQAELYKNSQTVMKEKRTSSTTIAPVKFLKNKE